MAKNNDRAQLYMCIGEEWRQDVPVGDVGDIKPLIEWMMKCYPGYEQEEVEKLFRNKANTEVTKYLLGSVGKRLVKV